MGCCHGSNTENEIVYDRNSPDIIKPLVLIYTPKDSDQNIEPTPSFGAGQQSNSNQAEMSSNPLSSHYKDLIRSQKSLQRSPKGSTVSSSEIPAESATDSSSNSVPEKQSSLYTTFNSLYLPSKDPLCECSAMVFSKFPEFEMLLELEKSENWEINIENSYSSIMIKTGTPTHPDIPLMKAFFDLGIDAEPEDIYNIMYNTEIRKKWDNSIGEFYEIEKPHNDVIQYYMLNKAPWPFKDRDFTEVRYIRRRINGDMEVYFKAIESQALPEDKNKAIRGETIVGGQIFRKRVSQTTGKQTLIVTVICQADLKGEIPKRALKITLPSTVLKWYKTVKKQLKNRL